MAPQRGYDPSQVDLYEVPGSLDIPLMTKRLAETGRYTAIVAAGFIVDGGLMLAANVWASARWMTADNIDAIPFSVDVFQANLSARF